MSIEIILERITQNVNVDGARHLDPIYRPSQHRFEEVVTVGIAKESMI